LVWRDSQGQVGQDQDPAQARRLRDPRNGADAGNEPRLPLGVRSRCRDDERGPRDDARRGSPVRGLRQRQPHNPETGEIIEAQRDPTIPGITKIRNNLNKLRRDGGKATDLEAFNALVHANRDDLQKIKDAEHTLWTGMGEDFDGFKAWIKARREQLTPKEASLEFQMLVMCRGMHVRQ
jgi:hypothetical protein